MTFYSSDKPKSFSSLNVAGQIGVWMVNNKTFSFVSPSSRCILFLHNFASFARPVHGYYSGDRDFSVTVHLWCTSSPQSLFPPLSLTHTLPRSLSLTGLYFAHVLWWLFPGQLICSRTHHFPLCRSDSVEKPSGISHLAF